MTPVLELGIFCFPLSQCDQMVCSIIGNENPPKGIKSCQSSLIYLPKSHCHYLSKYLTWLMVRNDQNDVVFVFVRSSIFSLFLEIRLGRASGIRYIDLSQHCSSTKITFILIIFDQKCLRKGKFHSFFIVYPTCYGVANVDGPSPRQQVPVLISSNQFLPKYNQKQFFALRNNLAWLYFV